jgi:LPS sulfotransferase NodH
VLAAPLPEQPKAPTSSYFICSSQRSGTWLLSGLLDSTGIAGHPHEYFEPGTEEPNRRRWQIGPSIAEYLASVLAVGTTENGVFACSVMWPAFASLLGSLREQADADDRLLIERIFPQPRFVFLWREDVVAQAVSWARAAQTGYYHHWDTPSGEARFDRGQIGALVRQASANTASWRRWFAENEIEPLSIIFEDLVESKEAETRRLLSFLGIAVPQGATIAERTTRTADAASEEWVARYRATAR